MQATITPGKKPKQASRNLTQEIENAAYTLDHPRAAPRVPRHPRVRGRMDVPSVHALAYVEPWGQRDVLFLAGRSEE